MTLQMELDLMQREEKYRSLARKLALALADEIACHGDPAEASLEAMNEAVVELPEVLEILREMMNPDHIIEEVLANSPNTKENDNG